MTLYPPNHNILHFQLIWRTQNGYFIHHHHHSSSSFIIIIHHHSSTTSGAKGRRSFRVTIDRPTSSRKKKTLEKSIFFPSKNQFSADFEQLQFDHNMSRGKWGIFADFHQVGGKFSKTRGGARKHGGELVSSTFFSAGRRPPEKKKSEKIDFFSVQKSIFSRFWATSVRP